MTPTEKASAAVSRLIRMTIENSIAWRPCVVTQGVAGDPDERVQSAYETTYESQRLVVYESFCSRATWDENESRHDYHVRIVGLVVTDGAANVVWRFPFVSGLEELLDAAQYQASGADSLLDSLISDQKPNSAA
jgi:hypothetical protein